MLPDHDSMVLNVLAFYADARPDERRAGFGWYRAARAAADSLARTYGVPLDTSAAVIAALSPQVEWTLNVRWAREVHAAYFAGDPLPPLGLGNSLRRAERALNGDRSDILREQGTLKVRNFFGSIVGERGAVCVDRHAVRVALGDASVPSAEVTLTDKRYRAVADAYRDAAREVHKRAADVQAVTWIVCKRKRDE